MSAADPPWPSDVNPLFETVICMFASCAEVCMSFLGLITLLAHPRKRVPASMCSIVCTFSSESACGPRLFYLASTWPTSQKMIHFGRIFLEMPMGS